MAEEIVIREGRAEDAGEVARLANELDIDQGGAGAQFSPQQVLADGFGPTSDFKLLVADSGSGLVGYAIYSRIYNTDAAAPGLWMGDLYVQPSHQSKGVGRKLLAAVAKAGREAGAVSVWWGTYLWNARAMAFYESCGATRDEVTIYELDEAAMADLAADSEN